MKRVLAFVVLLAAAPLSAAPPEPGAHSGAGVPVVEPYYVASPDQLIRQAVDRIAGFLMGSREADPEQVRAFVARELAPYFDFGYMARFAAGPSQHRLAPEHQTALTARLREMFLDALARHLGALARPLPRIDVFPARPGRSMSDAVVLARVLAPGQAPLRLEFRFYWDGRGWKVYDTIASGASAVAFYRSYFARLLRRDGPDALLRRE